MNTYNNLPPTEKAIIDKQADLLIKAIREKTKHRIIGPSFGKHCAVELLCRIGIWLNKEMP